MRTALVTGATGFLGGHVVRALDGLGWRVRALARDPPRAATLLPAGTEIYGGDLSAATDLEGACRDCEAIVHVAGLVKARGLEDYREVNARGTERLLRAAARSAPGALFLLVSSQAAVGPARMGRPVAESDAPRPISWYGLSKREGEEAVECLWAGAWIIVRPAVIYGPGDRGLLTIFRAAARGMVPVPGDGRHIQVIAAEEAAAAIARAVERRDLVGRRGFLCDPEPIAVRALCVAIASLPPKPARLVRVPDFAVRAAGLLASIGERALGRSLAFNSDKAREILAGEWVCDPLPLRRDLGLGAPTPLEDGLRETWNWYAACGWLPL
ncbi:MAG TPA: NAD-dependent epimerase/dehydratase family protein [Thermoanaerobaculia bacterium]|nr:NAD-dependent epimerase/dehydratase family protein [Thermoanaerobaculia bacterium]